MTALILDVPREVFERFARLDASGSGLGLDRRDVRLQNLEIVQLSEHVLRPLNRAHVRRRLPETAVGGQLEAVPEFLRGDAHGMQSLGRVHVAGLVHRGREPAGSGHQPCGQRLPPRFGRRLGEGRADRRQPAIQLFHVDVLETLEHQLAAALPLLHHADADVFYRGSGHLRRARQLVEQLDRHIQFADRAERAGQPPDLPAGFARLAAFEASRQHRHGLSKPSRCHAGLMDPVIVACHRLREMTLQGPGEALK